MKFIVAILLIAALPVLGQTAKVVQLSPEDATKAKQLYDAQLAAEKAYADFQVDIGNRYVSHAVTWPTTACAVICPDGDCSKAQLCTPPKPTPEQEKNSHGFLFNDGWTYGFEFSADFKFIVPKDAPKWTPSVYGGTAPWCGNVLTVNPIGGTSSGTPLTIGPQ
jgi:hypothetical protein